MYHVPISDELAIKLSADRILNFLSETLSVPDEVRDLLRKNPRWQEQDTLTNLMLITADEYKQDSFNPVLSCGDLDKAAELLWEWMDDHTNIRNTYTDNSNLAKWVPTKDIVLDAIVQAAKTGPSLPAANPRDVIDELTLALPDNQAISNLKVVAKHTHSVIFAQNILADTSSLTRVGYRVRFYEGAIPYTYPVSDVLHIFPRHRGFGYEEYIAALVDAHRQKQAVS